MLGKGFGALLFSKESFLAALRWRSLNDLFMANIETRAFFMALPPRCLLIAPPTPLSFSAHRLMTASPDGIAVECSDGYLNALTKMPVLAPMES